MQLGQLPVFEKELYFDFFFPIFTYIGMLSLTFQSMF